jgi:CIC family chloride channel protein
VKKSVASVVLNALGGSVGREGPIVQLAASGASRLAQGLRVPLERRRVLIGCGAAAGMAAAYNAPIGAAMFVMEVVHGNFALEIFGPVVLAAVTATMVSWGAFGSAPLYPVPLEPSPSLFALPLFALLGALVAWTGVVLRTGLDASERLFRAIPLPLPVRTGMGGLIVGLLAWWIPEVWGNGYDGVREVLAATVPIAILLPLLASKIVATSASLGSGGSGGVFTPALLVGAAGGALFGIGRLDGPARPERLPGLLRAGRDDGGNRLHDVRTDHRSHHRVRNVPELRRRDAAGRGDRNRDLGGTQPAA